MYKEIDLFDHAASEQADTISMLEQRSYAAYMIIGSYFHRCYFSSKLQELHLRIQFLDLPLQRQYSIEDKIEALFKEECGYLLPFFQNMNCECSLLIENNTATVTFETGFESVTVIIDSSGFIEVNSFVSFVD